MICEVNAIEAKTRTRLIRGEVKTPTESVLEILAETHIGEMERAIAEHRRKTDEEIGLLNVALLKLAAEVAEAKNLISTVRAPGTDEWKLKGQPVGNRVCREVWAVKKRWAMWKEELVMMTPIQVARKWGVHPSSVAYARNNRFVVGPKTNTEDDIRMLIDDVPKPRRVYGKRRYGYKRSKK